MEQFFQQYKSKGLEVVWVLGEDENKNAPSLEWCKNWELYNDVSYTVVRDSSFYQVYGAVSNFGISSLPHQYLIDATNMELLYATGGKPKNDAGEYLVEQMIVDMLAVPGEGGASGEGGSSPE